MIDVVLPVLDEADALRIVLPRMPSEYRPIVVDNGSSDNSGPIAESLGAQVVSETRRGFGAACFAGLEAATSDIVCFMDCDASFDPHELPYVANPIRDNEADLMLGARKPTTGRAWPFHARAANRIMAKFIAHRTGITITDLGPMRAARRAELQALNIQDRGFGWPLEMVLRAARHGWRISEVSVTYAPRIGHSKVTGTIRGSARAARDMARVAR